MGNSWKVTILTA
uniref:Uncharacterized protein n=1 Tax=Vitis vinifera TaxID=29760 RepID=F6HI64_VITVI